MEEVEDWLRKRRAERGGIRLRDAKIAGGHDRRCRVDQHALDVKSGTSSRVMVCSVAPARLRVTEQVEAAHDAVSLWRQRAKAQRLAPQHDRIAEDPDRRE